MQTSGTYGAARDHRFLQKAANLDFFIVSQNDKFMLWGDLSMF